MMHFAACGGDLYFYIDAGWSAAVISGFIFLVTVCGIYPLAASAAGELVQSWRTDDGWLTELRVHPNGAKV
jgi:hypothetical protein